MYSYLIFNYIKFFLKQTMNLRNEYELAKIFLFRIVTNSSRIFILLELIVCLSFML